MDPGYSTALRECINRCLDLEAAKRPSAAQLKGTAPLLQREADFKNLLNESNRRKRSTVTGTVPARSRSRMSSIPWGIDGGTPVSSPLKRTMQFNKVKTALYVVLSDA